MLILKKNNPSFEKSPIKITSKYYRKIIENALQGTISDLQKQIQSTQTPAIQRTIAIVLYKIIINGNFNLFEKLVEIAIGKNSNEAKIFDFQMDSNDLNEEDLKQRIRSIYRPLEEEI